MLGSLDIRTRQRLAVGLSAVAALLMVLVLRREMSSTPVTPDAVGPQRSSSPRPVVPPARSITKPSVAPAAAPSVVEEEQRPESIDGKDAEAWRNVLRGAVTRSNAGVAAEAITALAAIDPMRFAEPRVLADAVSAANLAASANQELEHQVFAVLGAPDLGQSGPDVLYRITTLHGGSRAARHAAVLLSRDEIIQYASPALLVAMALRDTPCNERSALYDRAAKDGDDRSLFLLQAMRADNCLQSGCCVRNDPKLEAAVKQVRERLSLPPD